MSYIIADAGSTKIEWALISDENKCELRVSTRGFNAASSSYCALPDILRTQAPMLLDADVSYIYYYGAGCKGERCEAVAAVLRSLFIGAHVEVMSDLLAAARAIFGRGRGVACILGTGSNTGVYDGVEIVNNTPPLGYILGDEGSGAVLGRLLIANVFKERLSSKTIELFQGKYPGLDQSTVVERVYRGDTPNAYLASFAPFISEHINIPEIEDMVVDEFLRFFKMNISGYALPDRNICVGFVGSIATVFKMQLIKAAELYGIEISHVVKSPIDGLIKFHASSIQ